MNPDLNKTWAHGLREITLENKKSRHNFRRRPKRNVMKILRRAAYLRINIEIVIVQSSNSPLVKKYIHSKLCEKTEVMSSLFAVREPGCV